MLRALSRVIFILHFLININIVRGPWCDIQQFGLKGACTAHHAYISLPVIVTSDYQLLQSALNAQQSWYRHSLDAALDSSNLFELCTQGLQLTVQASNSRALLHCFIMSFTHSTDLPSA